MSVTTAVFMLSMAIVLVQGQLISSNDMEVALNNPETSKSALAILKGSVELINYQKGRCKASRTSLEIISSALQQFCKGKSTNDETCLTFAPYLQSKYSF